MAFKSGELYLLQPTVWESNFRVAKGVETDFQMTKGIRERADREGTKLERERE